MLKLRADTGDLLWARPIRGDDGRGVAAFGIASDGAFAHYVTGSYWASDVTVGDVTLTNADGGAEDPTSDGLVFKISE